jgi:single-strand DNA-binding protein
MSINLVVISGNVGRDAELREIGRNRTDSSQASARPSYVCNFSIATNEGWYDKSGVLQKRTVWHNIVVWGNLAEYAARVALKGRGLLIIGKSQTREYVDKDGITRRTTEIIANSIECPNFSVRNNHESGYEGEYEEAQEFVDEAPAPTSRVPISAKPSNQKPLQSAKPIQSTKPAQRKAPGKSKSSNDIPF